MRRSKVEHYVHLVWATKGREPLLTEEIERAAHRSIHNTADKLECVVHAIGGMPDHVHLVVWLPTKVSVAQLMQQFKGVSSALINDMDDHQLRFRWQDGFAVFSVSRSHLKPVIAYVHNQKQHHAEGTIHPSWEETDEAAPV